MRDWFICVLAINYSTLQIKIDKNELPYGNKSCGCLVVAYQRKLYSKTYSYTLVQTGFLMADDTEYIRVYMVLVHKQVDETLLYTHSQMQYFFGWEF